VLVAAYFLLWYDPSGAALSRFCLTTPAKRRHI
jgi:hypothetical protein